MSSITGFLFDECEKQPVFAHTTMPLFFVFLHKSTAFMWNLNPFIKYPVNNSTWVIVPRASHLNSGVMMSSFPAVHFDKTYTGRHYNSVIFHLNIIL